MTKTKKLRNKPHFQWCIKQTYVNELMGVSKDLSIDELTFEIGFSLKRVVSKVPTHLSELGVTSLREPTASMEAQGILQGSRSRVTQFAKQICHELQLDYRHMRVRRMQVSHNGTVAHFTRMTKQMDTGEDDKTIQVKVMGLVKHDGTDKGVQDILKLLVAKKVHCVYSTKPMTTVLCTE